MVMPTTSYPCFTSKAAATELSTPPLIATRIRSINLKIKNRYLFLILFDVCDDQHQYACADAELRLIFQSRGPDFFIIHKRAVGAIEIAQ